MSWIESAKALGDTGERPSTPVNGATIVHTREGLTPYAASAIAQELARLQECSRLGWGGPPWDTTTFEVACNLLEFANSPWAGYTHAQAEADFYSNAPTDENFARRKHEEKWRSALARVGSGSRPEPTPRDQVPAVTKLDDGQALEPSSTTAGPLGSTWLPVDLTDVLAGLREGTLTRPQPTVGQLPDGRALFYRARVNGIHGDSTAGKTWTALALAREQLGAGESVVYVDLEDDAIGMVTRLQALGVDLEAAGDQFCYIRPAEPLDAVARAVLLDTVKTMAPSLVVVDTTGEALALEGANPNADEDVALWMRRVARSIADLGPAVVLLDHIPKSSDGSTPLQPIGSQRKRAAITGAQYAQESRKGFSREKDGLARLVCGKDRGGTYSTGQHVADIHIGPGVVGTVELREPETSATKDGGHRPTYLMEKVSDYLADNPESSQSDVTAGVNGRKVYVIQALKVLVNEGYVSTTGGRRNATFHALSRPYREADDTTGTGRAEIAPKSTVSGSGSLGGEPGNRSLTSSGNRSGTGSQSGTDGLSRHDWPDLTGASA